MSHGKIVAASLIVAGILFSSFAAAQLVKGRKVEVVATSYDNLHVPCVLNRHFALSWPAKPFGTDVLPHPLEIDLCGGR